MAQVSATDQMTAEEFLAAPVPSHGRPWNLVGGEVVVNEPTIKHGQAQMNIVFAIESWCRAAPGRGQAGIPIDIGIDDRNVFAPDVRWYREGRVPALDARPPYPMPDLAVEVRSPSTWRYDVGAKRAGYESHALPELWLVDTLARSVLVYRRSAPDNDRFDVSLELGSADQLTSPMLPGFSLSVGSITSA